MRWGGAAGGDGTPWFVEGVFGGGGGRLIEKVENEDVEVVEEKEDG